MHQTLGQDPCLIFTSHVSLHSSLASHPIQNKKSVLSRDDLRNGQVLSGEEEPIRALISERHCPQQRMSPVKSPIGRVRQGEQVLLRPGPDGKEPRNVLGEHLRGERVVVSEIDPGDESDDAQVRVTEGLAIDKRALIRRARVERLVVFAVEIFKRSDHLRRLLVQSHATLDVILSHLFHCTSKSLLARVMEVRRSIWIQSVWDVGHDVAEIFLCCETQGGSKALKACPVPEFVGFIFSDPERFETVRCVGGIGPYIYSIGRHEDRERVSTSRLWGAIVFLPNGCNVSHSNQDALVGESEV